MASADKRALADGFAIGQYLSPRRAAAMERSGAGERSEPEERSVMAAARGYIMRFCHAQGDGSASGGRQGDGRACETVPRQSPASGQRP